MEATAARHGRGIPALETGLVREPRASGASRHPRSLIVTFGAGTITRSQEACLPARLRHYHLGNSSGGSHRVEV